MTGFQVPSLTKAYCYYSVVNGIESLLRTCRWRYEFLYKLWSYPFQLCVSLTTTKPAGGLTNIKFPKNIGKKIYNLSLKRHSLCCFLHLTGGYNSPVEIRFTSPIQNSVIEISGWWVYLTLKSRSWYFVYYHRPLNIGIKQSKVTKFESEKFYCMFSLLSIWRRHSRMVNIFVITLRCNSNGQQVNYFQLNVVVRK